MIRLKENSQKTDRKGTGIMKENRYELNKQLAQMLKGGVIMDVTTPEQAKIAEEAGACAVMALERIPADIRAPYIADVYGNAETLAVVDGKVVAARQGSQLATAFHPELNDDTSVHAYFVEMIKGSKAQAV